MKTLEDFIIDQCGMTTPKLLELLEPHREFVEKSIIDFNYSDLSWKVYSDRLWKFLPHPKQAHFRL